jgi:hypothetical protein
LTINLNKEVPVLLREFGKLLPERVPYYTLRRWWRAGCTNRETGANVKLETVRLPTGRATTMEAYNRFVANLSAEKSRA